MCPWGSQSWLQHGFPAGPDALKGGLIRPPQELPDRIACPAEKATTDSGQVVARRRNGEASVLHTLDRDQGCEARTLHRYDVWPRPALNRLLPSPLGRQSCPAIPAGAV